MTEDMYSDWFQTQSRMWEVLLSLPVGVLIPDLLSLQVNIRLTNLLPHSHDISCASQAHLKLLIIVWPAFPYQLPEHNVTFDQPAVANES